MSLKNRHLVRFALLKVRFASIAVFGKIVLLFQIINSFIAFILIRRFQTHFILKASLEVRAAGRRAVNTLAGANMSDSLVILHFNDVYNVEPRQSPEPVGGAARFCTAIKTFQHLNPLVLFSGDAFSPSMRK